MIAVKKVKPLDDYQLLLVFDNQEQKIFDLKPYLEHGIFSQLSNPELFRTVKVSFDTIEWANGADLCPEVLYEESKALV
jgi:hypothetical protein